MVLLSTPVSFAKLFTFNICPDLAAASFTNFENRFQICKYLQNWNSPTNFYEKKGITYSETQYANREFHIISIVIQLFPLKLSTIRS